MGDSLGSSSPPTPRQLLHGRHPLYPVILGVSDGLIPTEASAGNPVWNALLNIPLWGPEHGLLESKEGAGIVAEVSVDILTHELTGSFLVSLAAGAAANLLVQRYYQPPPQEVISFFRVHQPVGGGLGALLFGGVRGSDYINAWKYSYLP